MERTDNGAFVKSIAIFQARLDRESVAWAHDSKAASQGTFRAALVALRQGLRCTSEDVRFVRAG